MKCRKNVKSMTGPEKAAYVNAVLKLKDPSEPDGVSIIPAAQADGAVSRYDDYVWLHQIALNAATNIHGGPAFGPWHREMLRQFEDDLRRVSGDDSITVPYWDWTLARQNGDDGWPFTNDFLGGFGAPVTTGAFAFATGDWNINVKDSVFDSDALTRSLAPNPETDPDLVPASEPFLPIPNWVQATLEDRPYDAVPYHEGPTTTEAQFFASFRKLLEVLLHNPVHNWVGGNMGDAASPNDPVFFLHHAAIDRLWSIWQDKFPQVDFVPTTGANTGHNLNDNMSVTDPAFYKLPPLRRPSNHIDIHSTGVWYESDLPRLNPPSLDVNFGDVFADLTTFRPITFQLEGCREVRFRVLAVGGSGFSVPTGWNNRTIPAQDDFDARDESMFIRFNAADALADGVLLDETVNGSATIEAYIVDEEGYFASVEGGEFVIDSWTFSLSATPVANERAAIAFVSDRSGSMSGTAGGGSIKFNLLTDALEVVTDLMDASDAVSLVFFDGAVSTPLPLDALNSAQITATLAAPAIQPAGGSTAIGEGIIEGVAQLNTVLTDPSTVYSTPAVVCLTDGNENVPPFVLDDPVSTEVAKLDNSLYAIGFGTEENVSADTLGAIANYMLITGNMSADERQFLLTKYFVQILAGVKGNEIIVDPQGLLGLGEEVRIPVDVSEADVRLDVVVLSPIAPLLEVALITPAGDVIDGASLGTGELRVNRKDLLLRVPLPALPADPSGSHAGRWHVRLRISKRQLDGLVKTRSVKAFTHLDGTADFLSMVATHANRGGLPYNVSVQTRSNLNLRLSTSRTVVAPGDPLGLAVNLAQYGVNLTQGFSATAVISGPGGHVSEHPLSTTATGVATLTAPTSIEGVYKAVVKVRGRTLGGRVFRREGIRTFAVKTSQDRKPGCKPSCGSGLQPEFCELIQCVLDEPGIQKWLDHLGISSDHVEKCLRRVCADPSRTKGPSRPNGHPDHGAGCDRKLTVTNMPKDTGNVLAKLTRKTPTPLKQPSHPSPATGMVMPMGRLNLDGVWSVQFMDHGDHDHDHHDPDGGCDKETPIADIKGFPAYQLSRLAHHGIKTAGDFLDADPSVLGKHLRVSQRKLNDLGRLVRTASIRKPHGDHHH